ncbi:spermidine/putrescine ABC transporter substrate-binding protein, partial [Streptococcus gordonii]|nr:spermidine/putrescine ABC transporter substrate-binding protein [Streptococcus gordonii]
HGFFCRIEGLKHLEVYQQLGPKWLGIYNDLYLQVKMDRK